MRDIGTDGKEMNKYDFYNKKTPKIFFGLIVSMLIFAMGIYFASASPGDSNDPVVTKSYVDKRGAFAPLHLSAGQSLIGGEGAEIILRSGEAAAIATGKNGVSDMTDGRDISAGQAIGLNHHLLVPRADGRGIRVSTEAWVMIRGDYKVQ